MKSTNRILALLSVALILATGRCQAVAAFQCGNNKKIRCHNHLFPCGKRTAAIGLDARLSPFRDKRNHSPEVSFARAVKSSLQTSTSSSQSRDDVSSSSPWSPGKWKIILQFRREDATTSSETLFDNKPPSNENNSRITTLLGNEWGSNGAQLVLPFDVLVTANVSSKKTSSRANNKAVQMAWLGGKPTGSIECIPQNCPSRNDIHYSAAYINEKGQQNVQISPGQWRIEPPIPLVTSSAGKVLPGQASTLRFCLTLETAIERNSIRFPQNQLLLLQCNTFREEQYETGVRTLLPYQYAKENAQQKLDEQLNHESGDRRLDGTDFLPLLEGYKDVAGLLWDRDDKYRKWKEVEGVLPLMDTLTVQGGVDIDRILDDETRWGVWPGDTDLLTIERGTVLALVDKKETKRGFFRWIENGDGSNLDTVVVGRWTAAPIWDD
ncbi:hypothetical protein HJC23_000953 [Cyclotella cryptica]|uniref:Uncharacterized protein n=1 Tax=Cyclotella cryptica TaxID=29204 RepID=A0ABD3QMM6_9STRA